MTSSSLIVTGLKSPPPEWVARLREIDPIRDAVSYLELVWFERAERWVLYEMVPAYDTNFGPTVPPEILAELKGVDPDLIPETAPLITRRQWLLYQQTGRWARPSWIIQGTKGGHLAAYDKPTIEMLKAFQRPTEPPRPGDLPYAPFDERVVQKVLEMNRFVKARNDLDEFRRTNAGDGGKRLYRDKLRDAREKYLAFIDAQAEEDADYFIEAHRKGEFVAEDVPTRAVDWVKKDDIATRNFVETGSFGMDPDNT